MKKIFLTVLILIITTFHSNISFADQNKNIDHITKNLRCLICQGQSVYDSQSEFALSIRDLVIKKIEEGQTDDEIYDYLKVKYGDWIIYDPKLDKNTILLWSIPLILFIFGFLLEIIADKQKSEFRAIPENKEKFITSGLWSRSRHPNYFGEIVLWTGIAVMSFSSLEGLQYLTLISPIFTYILLVYISGVRMLEGRGDVKWGDNEDYKNYKKNTPVLFLKLRK